METPQKQSGSNKMDALVMLLATVGVAVVLNAILSPMSARLDLTQQKIHTLSDASVAAAEALEGVTITAYISKKLPDSLPTPGEKVPLKGIDRAFRDKLEEYVRASHGKVHLVYAEDNSPGVGTIEDQADASKVELFSSSEAQVSGGQLKFQRYALGATFHYHTVHEVMAKALQPSFYEFEITKILLRLKEKEENSQLIKEPLAKAKALLDGVKACNDALQKIGKIEDKPQEDAGLSLKGNGDPAQKRVDAIKAARPELDKACLAVRSLQGEASKILKGKNQFGDNLMASSEQFIRVYDELNKTFDGKAESDKQQIPPAMAVAQLLPLMDQLSKEVDRSHTTLSDSPGRKQIGFLCGNAEFCPFGENEPFVAQEVAMMMAQNNPMMKQIVQAATQIAQAVDETNGKIGDNLFTKRGYSIRRVNDGDSVPDDVAAMIVYAPRKPITDYGRYQLDQVLMSGRPVVVLAQEWSVSLMNLAAGEDVGNEMRTDYTALEATSSNLPDVLKPYGVVLNRDLILDSKHVETVKVMSLVSRGGLQFQTQQDFPYALIPVAVDFDRSHPLTRSLQNLALPYTTSVDVTPEMRKDKRFEVVDVIRSSKTSLKKSAPMPVLPPALKEVVLNAQPNGPHTLALYVRGPFKSAFAGKEIPKKPEKEVKQEKGEPPRPKPNTEADYELEKRKFKSEGTGKLLVIASNLGIEGLSRADVLAGFDIGKLGQFSADTIKQFQQWQVNYQNWQVRIGQVSHLLPTNLQFLANVLDWSTSHEALVAIRSKGDVRRPLEQIEPEQAKKLRVSVMLGAPLLLIAFGIGRWRMRRARHAAIKI